MSPANARLLLSLIPGFRTSSEALPLRPEQLFPRDQMVPHAFQNGNRALAEEIHSAPSNAAQIVNACGLRTPRISTESDANHRYQFLPMSRRPA